MTQQDIRKQTLVLRDQISKQQHSQDSERICRRVLELQCVRDADSVLTYAPIRSEVDVWPLTIRLTEQGKTVLLPVVSEDALVLKEYRCLLYTSRCV